jgi:hypothetical protein
MERQRATREDRVIEDRDEQREGRQAPLADDLQSFADPVHRDEDPGRDLVPSAQHEERVTREGRLAGAKVGERFVELDPVDEPHRDVRSAVSGRSGTELAADGSLVAWGSVHQPDAGQSVDVEIDRCRRRAARHVGSGEGRHGPTHPRPAAAEPATAPPAGPRIRSRVGPDRSRQSRTRAA